MTCRSESRQEVAASANGHVRVTLPADTNSFRRFIHREHECQDIPNMELFSDCSSASFLDFWVVRNSKAGTGLARPDLNKLQLGCQQRSTNAE